MTAKQIRFCEEYLIDFNATQAAIRAGYSKHTGYAIGCENLKKPQIKAFIDQRLEELSLSAKEVTKLITDIAKSSLNDYLVVTETVHYPNIEKSLKEIIGSIKAEIEDADKFISRAGITNSEALESHRKQQEDRRMHILQLEIELERNPRATKIVQEKPVIAKTAQLDLVRLAADKKAGKIKTFKPTEHGVSVELYPADAALRDLARIHGLFQDNLKLDAGEELMNLYKTVMQRK